jgi:hypothetical protein
MSDCHYQGRLTNEDVVDLLRGGIYRVDVCTGEVFNAKGRKLQERESGRQGDRKFVRLYGFGKKRKVSLPSLIWMAANDTAMPRGFQIHHCDEDRQNHAPSNLACVFGNDHPKLHRSASSDVPF